MKVKRIKVKNFKNFAEKEISLTSITFFQGANGTGKTTLALESILFALFGYTPKDTLSDLPTRNKAKSCTVEVELEYKGHIYIIKRSYPTKISVKQDEEELKFNTSAEANRFLSNLFGSRDNFMRFRIVDAYSKDADVLGQGQASIKKIIFSLYEDMFNNAKTKLQAIKNERERFNKDGAIVYTHYPSDKRLEILKKELIDLNNQASKVQMELYDFEQDYHKETRQKSELEGKKNYNTSQKKKLEDNKSCYVCNQAISEAQQTQLLNEINDKIKNLNEQIEIHTVSLEQQKEIITQYKATKDKLQAKKEPINRLKMRLETRMKQKEFKYTNKDVLIVKRALDELDKLSSYYLTESIRVLEPIINSILEKIDFKVRFEINNKGKFAIMLTKDDVEYKYKDLSTGQKLLLQIAFKLALLMQNNETGIIIADEGMSSLDSENLQHVLSIFENYPYQLLFVIHNLNDVSNNIKVIDLNKGE